ncbi:MAG: hypothetical protein F4066_03625, partial [Chloroflexi bacterium]|nr:hypothetical protein [Chloroflexota bacterium]
MQRATKIQRRQVIGALCWAALGLGVLTVVLRQIASLDAIVFAPIAGCAVVGVFVLARRWGDWGILVAYVVSMGFFIQLRDAADEKRLLKLTRNLLK